MSYETTAPTALPVLRRHTADQVEDVPITAPARPAAGFTATTVVAEVSTPTPGVTTYRLKGTETTLVE